MAGAPWGMGPVGTAGYGGGDLTPWFNGLQLQQQRWRDWQNQQAQQQQQALAERQFSAGQVAQGFNQKIAELELKAAGENAAFNRDMRVKELQANERNAQANRDYQAGRDRTTDAAQASRDQEAANARAAKEAEAAKQEAAQKADEERRSNLIGVGTKTTAIIAQKADALRATLAQKLGRDPTPEEMRDAMLSETAQTDVSPEERAAMQKAIDMWYQDAVATVKRTGADTAKPEPSLSPASKASYWKATERDVRDEIDTLQGIINAAQSEDPDTQEFANFAATKYGGVDAIQKRLKDAQKRLEEAQAQLSGLLGLGAVSPVVGG